MFDKLNISTEEYEFYGKDKVKLSLDLLKRDTTGKLILMTSINPTPAGEGKTTMNIALSMALNRLDVSAISCLREPSLGPNFGRKGAATGGGKCEVLPAEDINLHFTGDFHAITTAHNLMAAFIDNHVFHGNELNVKDILFKRVLDMNDRALRKITLSNGRADAFDITVTSEIMAILCLVRSYEELELGLSNILVAKDINGKNLYAKDFGVVDAMMRLLKEALKPNLVKTTEGTPAIIHGGPFANIAHGCNSLIATETGLKLADYVVTEAGFGADLGAEKFFNIKCRKSGLAPSATVLIVSIRALKIHGGQLLEDLEIEDLNALEKGFPLLDKHHSNMLGFNQKVILALNVFESDSQNELDFIKSSYPDIVFVDAFNKGSDGAMDLAKRVISETQESPSELTFTYNDSDTYVEKINKIVKNIYGGESVSMSDGLLSELNSIADQSMAICVAKTQYSLSDNPKLLGIPEAFSPKITDIKVCEGARFVVVYMGRILTMPGLPKTPRGMVL